MQTATKHENNEILVIILKHVNHPRTPKQWDGAAMMVLVEMVVWMMMMIPMKSSLMTVLMATISPLREGISPVEICLPKSSFSLCSLFPAEAAESFYGLSPNFRVSGGRYRQKAEQEVGQGGHTP